jgi:serine/threonine-protein kinase
VVRTNPAAGTALPLGGTVTLVVSRGEQPPQQVRVPFVIGKRFDEAQQILEEVGLQAEEQPGFGGLGRDDGRVIDQSNGAGSMVDRGTTIVLDTL